MGQRVGGPPGVVRGVVIAQAVQPGPAVQRQPEQSHRLNAKKLHITQAALAPDEVTNEQVLAMARARGTLTEWSIGDEVHPQPADPARPRHKHYYLHYADAINHRDARHCTYFDLIGAGGRVLHPHIQSVGSSKEDRSKVIHYTQKDKLYIASPNLMNFDAEKASGAKWAIEMNQAETVRGGMTALNQRYPEVFYLHAQRVEYGLEMRIGKSCPSQFSLSDFTEPRIPEATLMTKAVIIQGASHVGKTQFALAHFKYPLLVSELDDLKSISLQTDGIVFDQMRFVHPEDRRKVNMTADEFIRLIDVEMTRSIHARYSNASIPRGMPRIFTTNRRVTAGEPIFPSGCNAQEQEGIDSRCAVTNYVTNDMRRSPAANVQQMRVGFQSQDREFTAQFVKSCHKFTSVISMPRCDYHTSCDDHGNIHDFTESQKM